ncbi:helix-turn-helix domain-containing protein [Vreelandella andesensis]|uniref:Helix-turn-helix domain-containing protein n=1 Tax=Vreelandella andesensis TaxID=447567 RepID=A0A433KF23_9GAMM|nr:helix-turn-helix domain-containing protein [Halomonas andesensis]RUR26817.1 helix-turn-helix domain-containing protein [Halomonas andesensis]
MSEHRAFRGVWIPAELWMTKELSIQEKLMLVEIDSLQHPGRGCFKSNRKMAEFFGLSAPRISAIISSLTKKGFIRVEQIRDGKQTVERRIFMERSIQEAFGGQDTKGGYSGSNENPSQDTKGGYSGSNEERGSGVRGSGLGVQSENPLVSSDDVTAVFEFWKTQLGKTRTTKLDNKRRTKIKTALTDYGMVQVQQAIIGCTLSAHHMGQNPQNKRYDDIELILRDAKHVEQFIGYFDRKPTNVSLYDNRPRPKHTGLDQANAAGLRQRADGAYSL